MADISIRNIPDDILSSLVTQATAAGYSSREAYIRDQLVRIAQQPLIRTRYGLRAYGDQGMATATILRQGDGVNDIGGGLRGASEAQKRAYNLAQDIVRRNNPGDRERAISELSKVFDEVFEVSA